MFIYLINISVECLRFLMTPKRKQEIIFSDVISPSLMIRPAPPKDENSSPVS